MSKFYHFNDGVPIKDCQTNEWITTCLLKVTRDYEPHWSISSGDTVVIAWAHDAHCRVLVANSLGWSTLSFGFHDPLTYKPYKRPEICREFRFLGLDIELRDYSINALIQLSIDETIKFKLPNSLHFWNDTIVAALRYPSELQVLVANSSGRSSICFDLDGPFDFEPYKRPKNASR